MTWQFSDTKLWVFVFSLCAVLFYSWIATNDKWGLLLALVMPSTEEAPAPAMKFDVTLTLGNFRQDRGCVAADRCAAQQELSATNKMATRAKFIVISCGFFAAGQLNRSNGAIVTNLAPGETGFASAETSSTDAKIDDVRCRPVWALTDEGSVP